MLKISWKITIEAITVKLRFIVNLWIIVLRIVIIGLSYINLNKLEISIKKHKKRRQKLTFKLFVVTPPPQINPFINASKREQISVHLCSLKRLLQHRKLILISCYYFTSDNQQFCFCFFSS